MSDAKTEAGEAADSTVEQKSVRESIWSCVIRNDNKNREDDLAKLENSLALNTEKKIGSCFSWVKHLSTLAAAVPAIVAAMYNGHFINSIVCFLCLMATMIFFALALYHSLVSLLGESMFYAAKCKNAWLAIINYEKGKKNDKAAMRNNHIDEDYERRAKKALFWFAMGLLSLLLYVVVTFIFNMLQKYDNDTYAEEILIFALCLPFFWFGGDWIYYQTQRFCIRLNLQNKYDDKNIPNNFQDKKQKNHP